MSICIMKSRRPIPLDRSDSAGFTLAEILVVIVIIGILITGIIQVGSYVRTSAQIKNTKTVISELVAALNEYQIHIRNLPGLDFPPGDRTPTAMFPLGDPPPQALDPLDFNGIIELYLRLDQVPACKTILDRIAKKNTVTFIDPVERLSYIVLVDAWKNERINQLNWLHYEYEPGQGNFPVIRSAGPDTLFGTADDIISTDI